MFEGIPWVICNFFHYLFNKSSSWWLRVRSSMSRERVCLSSCSKKWMSSPPVIAIVLPVPIVRAKPRFRSRLARPWFWSSGRGAQLHTSFFLWSKQHLLYNIHQLRLRPGSYMYRSLYMPVNHSQIAWIAVVAPSLVVLFAAGAAR